MTTSRFDPKWPGHAIERCSLTLALKDAIPEKLFTAIKDEYKPSFQNFGLIEQPVFSVSLDFSAGSSPGLSDNVAATNYVVKDNSAALTVMPKAIVWGTSRYSRWSQFKEQLEALVFPILQSFLKVSDVVIVRSDYIDRFLWTGSWDDFNLGLLLRPGLNIMPLVAERAKRERHSHNGWFENNGRLRRLINRNVDVAQVPHQGGLRPAVGIYTLVQDEYVLQRGGENPLAGMAAVQHAIEQQHVDLKAMLSETISESMGKRIGLIPGGWQNAGT